MNYILTILMIVAMMIGSALIHEEDMRNSYNNDGNHSSKAFWLEWN